MKQNSSPATPLALYIHWPFCKSKCPYCDFNSHVRDKIDANAWQVALLTELEWYARVIESYNRPILHSIFFGGGTPSLMPPQIVEALIQKTEQLFGFTPDVEITLEANPTSVEASRFEAFRRAGVNRVSLGIQSLREDQLKFLGREHNAEEARAAIALATSIFPRASFDLIYALPGQSVADWQAQLQAALPLTKGHLSLYQLTIEPGTQFYHHFHAGKFALPDESLATDLYLATQEIIEAAGLPAYETSNHAAPGESSRHNLAYWNGHDYLGIGPGAHGRITLSNQRHATLNFRSPEKWLAQVQQQGHGQESSAPLTLREQIEERLLMGLRVIEGLNAATFEQQTGATLFSLWSEKTLAPLYEEGLLQPSPSHLVPTRKGHLLLNSLTGYLVKNMNPGNREYENT
jgi:putative oxygen-independent coproporphyrinogen III oxidase